MTTANPKGWEVFDPRSANTIVIFRWRWQARLLTRWLTRLDYDRTNH